MIWRRPGPGCCQVRYSQTDQLFLKVNERRQIKVVSSHKTPKFSFQSPVTLTGFQTVAAIPMNSGLDSTPAPGRLHIIYFRYKIVSRSVAPGNPPNVFGFGSSGNEYIKCMTNINLLFHNLKNSFLFLTNYHFHIKVHDACMCGYISGERALLSIPPALRVRPVIELIPSPSLPHKLTSFPSLSRLQKIWNISVTIIVLLVCRFLFMKSPVCRNLWFKLLGLAMRGLRQLRLTLVS
eukprot:sb/3469249/